MENAVIKARSFHDDIVLRLIFVIMNELLNGISNKYADPAIPLLYFSLVTAITVFPLVVFSNVKQQPFAQDMLEFCVIDLTIKCAGIATFVFAHDTLYQPYIAIQDIAVKIIYLALWLRIFWPCREKTLDLYRNWPVFGPIGLWHKLRKAPWPLCPATARQALAAYAGMVAAGVAGYWLWRYQISNVQVFVAVGQLAILAFIAVVIPPRAMRWWQAHQAAIEADRAAKDAAERAASQARQIIMQQAQQSVDFEAAKIAAEYQAKAAHDEAAQLREQLANPPPIAAPEAPPPHPVLAMLDRNSDNFDAGLYLTLLARQERTKYTGKTKEQAKLEIYEALAPVAVELGIRSTWRTKRHQPNRALLESCIMAGLVGFGGEA